MVGNYSHSRCNRSAAVARPVMWGLSAALATLAVSEIPAHQILGCAARRQGSQRKHQTPGRLSQDMSPQYVGWQPLVPDKALQPPAAGNQHQTEMCSFVWRTLCYEAVDYAHCAMSSM